MDTDSGLKRDPVAVCRYSQLWLPAVLVKSEGCYGKVAGLIPLVCVLKRPRAGYGS